MRRRYRMLLRAEIAQTVADSGEIDEEIRSSRSLPFWLGCCYPPWCGQRLMGVPGLDNVITRYTNHPPGGAVELWTALDAGHGLNPSPQFSPRVIDWLLTHPRL